MLDQNIRVLMILALDHGKSSLREEKHVLYSNWMLQVAHFLELHFVALEMGEHGVCPDGWPSPVHDICVRVLVFLLFLQELGCPICDPR
jgi:hypothetical protein